ncbi:hypothetical protein ABVT39_003416 [Epinephelus coioides]
MSCGLLEPTNGTRHGEHEQRARRSQPDNDAITRLRGHITAWRTTLSALVLELHQQVPARNIVALYQRRAAALLWSGQMLTFCGSDPTSEDDSKLCSYPALVSAGIFQRTHKRCISLEKYEVTSQKCRLIALALGLNGDGRSFTVDLNVTASLMARTPLSGARGIANDGRDETTEERVGMNVAAEIPVECCGECEWMEDVEPG